MPECEAYPDMRAHEDARLTDEVPESVCFIIMDSKMSSGGSCRRNSGGIPGYIESRWKDICRNTESAMVRLKYLLERRNCTDLLTAVLDKKENMWVRTQ